MHESFTGKGEKTLVFCCRVTRHRKRGSCKQHRPRRSVGERLLAVASRGRARGVGRAVFSSLSWTGAESAPSSLGCWQNASSGCHGTLSASHRRYDDTMWAYVDAAWAEQACPGPARFWLCGPRPGRGAQGPASCVRAPRLPGSRHGGLTGHPLSICTPGCQAVPDSGPEGSPRAKLQVPCL